ncbi:GTP-binding protein Di-Ras1-like [Xenia sp. Carnegie-2017]|uniref:GTP-binding protein Di-Ras1-like n=1 Tax=Xenia sp. Carnegie-2017 TaxID=2897299 RepID=UPI001F03BAFB|nr:GTP-binding protein Di-Ras1-like [Xenia sp. Carnegie-2017]
MPKCRVRYTINNYKLVIFGSAAVGKSSLVRRFIFDEFRITYRPTVEECYRYMMHSKNYFYNLTIVDTGGSHEFPAMKDLHITGSAAFILVLSVDDVKSLNQFMKDSKIILEKREDAKILIVLNKIDKQNRAFSAMQIIGHMEKYREWNSKFQYKYLETSAENNNNVRKLFNEVIDLLSPVCQCNGKKGNILYCGLSQSCTML